MKPIALLAGEGQMPLRILEGIHAAGKQVLLLAVDQVTDPALIQKADHVVVINITQLGTVISSCKRFGSKELLMAGRIHHKKVLSYTPWKYDWTAFKLWWKLKDYRADSLLKAFTDMLEKAGITVMSSVTFLKNYLAKEGVLTQRKPSKLEIKNAVFGISIAKELGRIDVGQTVVVKNMTVVAVEAMEGTDLCLERAGQIAGAGCIVVKMPKPNQDMRFDVPVVGNTTLQKMKQIGAELLVIEAVRTLLIDPDMISEANKLGISIVAFSKEQTE